MTERRVTSTQAESLHAGLSSADDRIQATAWLPPQDGIAPRIRCCGRWINVLWAIPIAFLLLVLGIAAAQELRTLPTVQAFILRYPGETSASQAIYSGFPWWLRLMHFLNTLFMVFIIRSGIQILADHPRLYWKRDCTPGTEWFRFQHEIPKHRAWTAKEQLGQPSIVVGHPRSSAFGRPGAMVAFFL